jgi:Flp pilus assembly protein protease CpaA
VTILARRSSGMTRLLDARNWSLLVSAALMLVAAAVNVVDLRVPNWLTFSSGLAALLVASLVTARQLPSQGGGIGPSFLLAFLAGLLLAPLYAVGWLGAGCVKMHMALGAWIGCAYPAQRGAKVTLAASLAGGLLTAAGMFLHAVLLAGKGAADGWPLFPAQLTLSLGAVATLAAAPFFFAREPEEAPPLPEASSAWADRLQQLRG